MKVLFKIFIALAIYSFSLIIFFFIGSFIISLILKGNNLEIIYDKVWLKCYLAFYGWWLSLVPTLYYVRNQPELNKFLKKIII